MKKDNLLDMILQATEGFYKISIFVHINPDHDALGAAFFLARFIKLNTHLSQVKIVGMDELNDSDYKNFFHFNDEKVTEEFVTDSLALIVDTANEERVHTGLHTYAKKSILVDHHVPCEQYTTERFIDESSIATCEMLGIALMNSSFNFDVKCLEYLFVGTTTDSNRFFYDKVTEKTHGFAGWCITQGLDHTKLYLKLYQRNISEVKIDAYLINQIHVEDGVGYIVVDEETKKKYPDVSNWSDKVYLMNNINEIKVWFVTYFDDTKGMYKASLRSSKYNVRNVAKYFNGGGHDLASGCTLKSLDEVAVLINLLKQQIREE
ncbi:DHH family phosphoesterase [Ureaplasma canigenitalium]|uniref:DHH family phosphoesterase n=1 Tax=Ureaplasma canigenitalium TaxID=42092 RepID=UPI0004E0E623|nr:bifunctional oligoribonuclease/PAP phosphatase NrnA [Ureaplasma canigenitalium]